MLDNKLYLISVGEFLCRSCVDRGMREGKVVVGTDLSKRKVLPPQFDPNAVFLGRLLFPGAAPLPLPPPYCCIQAFLSR